MRSIYVFMQFTNYICKYIEATSIDSDRRLLHIQKKKIVLMGEEHFGSNIPTNEAIQFLRPNRIMSKINQYQYHAVQHTHARTRV